MAHANRALVKRDPQGFKRLPILKRWKLAGEARFNERFMRSIIVDAIRGHPDHLEKLMERRDLPLCVRKKTRRRIASVRKEIAKAVPIKEDTLRIAMKSELFTERINAFLHLISPTHVLPLPKNPDSAANVLRFWCVKNLVFLGITFGLASLLTDSSIMQVILNMLQLNMKTILAVSVSAIPAVGVMIPTNLLLRAYAREQTLIGTEPEEIAERLDDAGTEIDLVLAPRDVDKVSALPDHKKEDES